MWYLISDHFMIVFSRNIMAVHYSDIKHLLCCRKENVLANIVIKHWTNDFKNGMVYHLIMLYG